MKTLLLFFSLILAATLGAASVNPIDLIVQADPTSHSLTVRMTTGVERPTTVKIVDRAGLVLHTTDLAAGEYLNTRFKLSALPQGTYNIVVTDDYGKMTQPLTIDAQGIVADPALASRHAFPRVQLKDKLVTVNYFNQSGRDVRIRILDPQGREVMADHVDDTHTVQRAYSLARLPAGDYSVIVSSADVSGYRTSLALQ